jgi:hypothetical protein
VRFPRATHLVCGFRFKDDAEEFYKALIKRLDKFGLSLSPDKTRIIKFSRFEKGTNYFEFLGFEFRWGTSRKGKDIIKRRTSRKKLLSSLKRFALWCQKCGWIVVARSVVFVIIYLTRLQNSIILRNLELQSFLISFSFTEASISEEPSAIIPHAGICAGAVG